MSECQNLEVRDVLPELVRGELEGSQLVAVEGHLATCASCRTELALLRDARSLMHGGPSVDSMRIAEAVVRMARLRREATTGARTRRQRISTFATPSRRVWLAAASVVAVASAVLLATSVGKQAGPSDVPPTVARVEEPTAPLPTPPRAEPVRPTPRAEIVMGGGVSDLADADLESLLSELEGLDAQVDVEPAVLVPLREGDV